MSSISIVTPDVPTWEMYDEICRVLVDYNHRTAGPSGHQLVAHLLKDDETDRTIGGLWGQFSYDWLFIELLIVPDGLRGTGYGTALMREAERSASARGAVGIWLDTFDFQARGFYEKLGFDVFGKLPDHPRGGARYFMRKLLAAPSDL